MVGVNVYSNHLQIRFQYICLLFRYIVFHWSVFTETHGKGYRILRLFWTSAYLKYITTFSRGLKYMPKWVWSVFRGSHSHKGENNHLYRNFYWEKSAWSEYGLPDDVEKRVEWGKSWYDRTMNIIRNGDDNCKTKFLTPVSVHVTNGTDHSIHILFYFASSDLQGNCRSAFPFRHPIIWMLIWFMPCIKMNCTKKVSKRLEPIPLNAITYKLGKAILRIRLNLLHSFKI